MTTDSENKGALAVAEPVLAEKRIPETFEAPVEEKASIMRRVLQDREGLLRDITRGRSADLRGAFGIGLALTAIGGLSLGIFNGPLQALSATVKMPMISLLSVVICVPALYVFAMFQGSKVRLSELLSMMAVGIALKGAIIAGIAPLLLFLSVVGSPYGFILGAACIAFGIAEVAFLRTLDRGVGILQAERKDPFSRNLLRLWATIYLLVAMQLIWSLRPLIGNPEYAFVLVEKGENMLAYLIQSFSQMGR